MESMHFNKEDNHVCFLWLIYSMILGLLVNNTDKVEKTTYSKSALSDKTDKVERTTYSKSDLPGQDRQSRKYNLLKCTLPDTKYKVESALSDKTTNREDNLLKKRNTGQHRQSRNDNLLKSALPDNTEKVERTTYSKSALPGKTDKVESTTYWNAHCRTPSTK